jgi:uncharacterized protein (TIGR02001 family)
VAVPVSAPASDLNGYIILTSDYVHRGVTYSDGDPAAQLGIDVSTGSGFFGGAWGSTLDIENGPARQRDLQVNYYLGYMHELTDRWSLSGSVVAYTFPGATGDVDYNYEEVMLAANYNDRFWFEYSWSPDLYGTGYETHNLESFLEYPVAGLWTLGGGIGYYDVSDFVGHGYAYWHIGLSRAFDSVDLDFRFHDTSRSVPVVSAPDRSGARGSVSLRVQF